MLTCANFTNPAHWEEQLQRVIAAVRGELRLAEVGSPPEELLEQRPVEFRPSRDHSIPATTNVDKRALREIMTQAFSIEELQVLCDDVHHELKNAGIGLAVDLDTVGGSGKTAKVLNLIQYLDRRGYLDTLVKAVRSARPGII
jgi:hypothetical protein